MPVSTLPPVGARLGVLGGADRRVETGTSQARSQLRAAPGTLARDDQTHPEPPMRTILFQTLFTFAIALTSFAITVAVAA